MIMIRQNFKNEEQYEVEYKGRRYLVSLNKFKCLHSEHCKDYNKCRLCDIPIKRFMCIKYANIYYTVIIPLIFWLSIVLAILLFFNDKKIVAVISFFVINFCSAIIIAEILPKISRKILISKLKKIDGISINYKSEERNIPEKIYNIDNLLIPVKEIIESLNVLLNQYDLGENNEKLSLCIKEVSELIKLIKNDDSDSDLNYKKLEYFFEIYLPEFEKTIRMYADLKEISNKNKEALTECIEKFALNLELQKNKLNNESSELEFYGQAKALIALIEKNNSV